MVELSWFRENTDDKIKFIIEMFLKTNPFKLGYLWFFLRFGKYSLRERKDGTMHIAFKKVYPIKAMYVARVLNASLASIINFSERMNRIYARFILPFTHRVFLIDNSKMIFLDLLRENNQVFSGVLSSIIDLYGKLRVGKKTRLIFRIPDIELEEAVLERVEIDKISIRKHGSRRYRYVNVTDKKRIERILGVIKPINPERILEIAIYKKAISKERAKSIRESLEERFMKKISEVKEGNEKLNEPEPTELDKAYLLGLATGDLAVTQLGNKIMAELSTTHPEAMLLFHRMFDKYGKVTHIPRIARERGRTYIYLRAYLNKDSWYFLMKKGDIEFIKKETRDIEKFKQFLAGLFDAEGTIIITRKKPTNRVQVITKIALSNKEILEYVKKKLNQIRIRTHIYKEKNTNCYKLTATSTQAIKLLETIPIKHTEKQRKAKIAKTNNKKQWTKNLKQQLNQYKKQIQKQKQELQKTTYKNQTTKLK